MKRILAAVLLPFVVSPATAGTITTSDLNNSSSLDAVRVVANEVAEDQDGNSVLLPTDFLSPQPATSQLGFLDLLANWLHGLDLPSVEVGEEVWSSDTGDVLPAVEQGVLTDTLTTPDLRTNVPEPESAIMVLAGLISLIAFAFMRGRLN